LSLGGDAPDLPIYAHSQNTPREEATMGRKMVDCRKMPSDSNCSLTIAGTEDEVIETAVAHAIAKHGHQDTPELREGIHASMEDAEAALA
jgi:hypothetical protein